MATTWTLTPVTVNSNMAGTATEQLWFQEAASQTFKLMEPVYLDNAGHVAAFTLGVDTGGQKFLGFAATAGNNLTTAGVANSSGNGAYYAGMTAVYVGQHIVFEANITNNGANTQALALTQIGTAYELFHDVGLAEIDIANTAGKLSALTIVGYNQQKYAVGDIGARVRFTLKPAALQVLGS